MTLFNQVCPTFRITYPSSGKAGYKYLYQYRGSVSYQIHTLYAVPNLLTLRTIPFTVDHVSDKEEACTVYEDYWQSEHHRFEHSEYAAMLCQLNPLSYHQVGLAVPGTFVKESMYIF